MCFFSFQVGVGVSKPPPARPPPAPKVRNRLVIEIFRATSFIANCTGGSSSSTKTPHRFVLKRLADCHAIGPRPQMARATSITTTRWPTPRSGWVFCCCFVERKSNKRILIILSIQTNREIRALFFVGPSLEVIIWPTHIRAWPTQLIYIENGTNLNLRKSEFEASVRDSL